MKAANNSLFFAVVAAVSMFLAASIISPACAKLKTVYSFCSEADCTDGENPQALLFNPSGDVIYGTTTFGGSLGQGTVFSLTRNRRGKWKHAVIYDFSCSGTCPGGWQPTTGRLIRDTSGNLYGTTQRGGVGGSGGVYELVKDHKTWHFKAVYDFCQLDHCADGLTSASLTYVGASTGVPYDGVSPLYGVSRTDGVLNKGVFFSLTVDAGIWTKTVLYTVQNESLGGSLASDAAGHFFGVGSTLFELEQSGGHWGLNTLHSFSGGADGNGPNNSLLVDTSGNLFGTTQRGGNFQNIGGGGGTIFEWNGSAFQTIADFCSLRNCKDGVYANGGATRDGEGNLIGTLDGGGKFGGGAIYRYNGSATELLHSFCKNRSDDNCQDGSEPYGEVLIDASGNIFGMTYNNAAGPHGAIFELVP